MINSGVDIWTGCNPLSSSRNFKGLWISPTFAVHGEVLWTGASNAPNLVSPPHHLPLLQRWCVDAGVFHKINIRTFGLSLTYSHHPCKILDGLCLRAPTYWWFHASQLKKSVRFCYHCLLAVRSVPLTMLYNVQCNCTPTGLSDQSSDLIHCITIYNA